MRARGPSGRSRRQNRPRRRRRRSRSPRPRSARPNRVPRGASPDAVTNPSGLSGLLFALAAASLYGVNIVSTRFAALAGISGVTLVFYRVFVMLALVAAAAALWRTPLRIAAGERGTVAVLGVATAALGAAYLSSV